MKTRIGALNRRDEVVLLEAKRQYVEERCERAEQCTIWLVSSACLEATISREEEKASLSDAAV